MFSFALAFLLCGHPIQEPAPFQRFYVEDRLGRRIEAYLSEATSTQPQPVALLILGSGCQSVFQARGEQTLQGMQHYFLKAARGKARVLIVEKPGVQYLDQAKRPGTAEGADPVFLREHTLERWGEANRAALAAVLQRKDVDASGCLVAGHSEGGMVAGRVAALEPKVSHVLSLAGGGVNQLFSLAELAARPQPKDAPDDGEQRRQRVFDGWQKVLQDPESTEEFWMGHPYRRWSGFLISSPLQEFRKSKAALYLIHGSEDRSSAVASFDAMVAELSADGRAMKVERLAGKGHGFESPSYYGPPNGMQRAFERGFDWFLKDLKPRQQW